MTVGCAVRDDGHNRLVAVLTGDLGLLDIVPLRVSLMKCLAEQPDALLVDLAGLAVSEPLALAVFAAVHRQAARWPGTPVLLYAAQPRTHTLLTGGALNRLPLFATREAARAHAGSARQTLPSLTDELLPISGAARQARNVTTEACLRWDLPQLVAPAGLVASELVSNVVDHAHTMMTLRLSLRRRFLNIAVSDGSSAEPVAPGAQPLDGPGGRGLFLVQATARSWGWLPTEGGKVVWAALAR
jgi:anti-sigma regulatory factor (Ser/Thr protein kinase)